MRLAMAGCCLLLLAMMSAWARDSVNNPRNYPIDILADTFGYSQAEVAIDLGDIYQACPKRDCIPSVDQPQFLRAAEHGALDADDLLLVVESRGVLKAYPTRYLDVHEIVNDEFAGLAVAVTYCPLCGSGLAFERRLDGKTVEFGVSGLLHNNDLIMYDRQSGSLWQQITGEAIGGPLSGTRLEVVPSFMATWAEWQAENPDALVLKPPTETRPYGSGPYAAYAGSDRLLFPVQREDARLHPKKVVYGIEVGDQAIAVDHDWLAAQGNWSHEVNGRKIELTSGPGGSVTGRRDGEPLAVHRMYWFAWYNFHPGTALIGGPD